MGIPLVGELLKIVDKRLPSKMDEKSRRELEQALELKYLDSQSEMIKAEGSSADAWTSRARPTFLYVVYAVIIYNYILTPFLTPFAAKMSLAMPTVSLPDSLWNIFGIGYLGYTGARTWEKNNKNGLNLNK